MVTINGVTQGQAVMWSKGSTVCLCGWSVKLCFHFSQNEHLYRNWGWARQAVEIHVDVSFGNAL